MGAKTGRPTDRAKAAVVATEVISAMKTLHMPGLLGVELAGSLRRGKEVVSDVDLVVWSTRDDLSTWNEFWAPATAGLAVGPIRWTPKGAAGDVLNVRVELYKAPSLDCVGATMLFTTGPASLNVYMRQQAMRRGWKLSQYGIRDADGVRMDACDGVDWVEDEGRMFDALEMPRMTAEQREEWARHVKTSRS